MLIYLVGCIIATIIITSKLAKSEDGNVVAFVGIIFSWVLVLYVLVDYILKTKEKFKF